MLKNLCIETYVRHDCNWKDALDDALLLASKTDTPVRVHYITNYHYNWVITPETTKEDMKIIKRLKVV